MKNVFKILIIILLSAKAAIAQTPDAKTLVREGIDLNNQKNYTGAIEKYKSALDIDADYAPGNYQMAFSLNAMGKGLDGIPYLQKVFSSTTASTTLLAGLMIWPGVFTIKTTNRKKLLKVTRPG